VAIIICLSLPEAFHLRDAERRGVPTQWGLTLLRFSAQIEHIPLVAGDVSGTNRLAVELYRNEFKLSTPDRCVQVSLEVVSLEVVSLEVICVDSGEV